MGLRPIRSEVDDQTNRPLMLHSDMSIDFSRCASGSQPSGRQPSAGSRIVKAPNIVIVK